MASAAALNLVGAFASPAGPAAAGMNGVARAPLWEEVLAPDRDEVAGLLRQADRLMLSPSAGREQLARVEALLRRALALVPDDHGATLKLGDVLAAQDRPAEALKTFQRARQLATGPEEQSACWHRIAIEHAKIGAYADAVAAYDLALASGDAPGSVYADSAELLMALGRLGEAQDRYRQAIRLDEGSGDRRPRPHGLALTYYGLGVALDRDQQPVAAREMISRALLLDPSFVRLQAARQPGGDAFFYPPGDVHYYVGLAAEVAGRHVEAEAAFGEFVAQLPNSPWSARARAHLTALKGGAPGAARRAPRGTRAVLKVAASATVLSQGPLPAPLIDAAWRSRPQLLDPCLARAPERPNRQPVRVSLDIDLDAGGRVTRVTAHLPPTVGEELGRCFEAAVKAGLIVPRPAHARPTSARMELLLAVE